MRKVAQIPIKLITDMASLGNDVKDFKSELENIRKQYYSAVKANNNNQASAQIELLKKLKIKISKAAMAQF